MSDQRNRNVLGGFAEILFEDEIDSNEWIQSCAVSGRQYSGEFLTQDFEGSLEHEKQNLKWGPRLTAAGIRIFKKKKYEGVGWSYE